MAAPRGALGHTLGHTERLTCWPGGLQISILGGNQLCSVTDPLVRGACYGNSYPDSWEEGTQDQTGHGFVPSNPYLVFDFLGSYISNEGRVCYSLIPPYKKAMICTNS